MEKWPEKETNQLKLQLLNLFQFDFVAVVLFKFIKVKFSRLLLKYCF